MCSVERTNISHAHSAAMMNNARVDEAGMEVNKMASNYLQYTLHIVCISNEGRYIDKCIYKTIFYAENAQECDNI